MTTPPPGDARAARLLDALAAYPHRDLHVFVRYDRAVVVTVPWTDTAEVRRIAAASGLAITGEHRYALTLTDALACRIRVETTIPAITLTSHIADAALLVNARLADGADHDTPYRSLRTAAQHPAVTTAIISTISSEVTGHPYGHPGPAHLTLATLLADNTGLTGRDLTLADVAESIQAAVHVLADTPELLDVATALDRDNTPARRIPAPPGRTPTAPGQR